MELENLVTDDDCVPGVVSSLEADDEVGFFVEVVNDLSLSFVSPLGSDNC